MATTNLQAKTKTELAELARRKRIRHWRQMSRGELLQALQAGNAATAETRITRGRVNRPGTTTRPRAASSSAPASRAATATLALKTSETASEFVGKTKKQLARLAREYGIAGLRSMRKDELVAALEGATLRPGTTTNGSATTAAAPKTELASPPVPNPAAPPAREETRGAHLYRRRQPGEARNRSRRILPLPSKRPIERDRIVLMVRDPYWLHVYWEITRQSLQRTEAALNKDWYGARPTLRLVEISADEMAVSTEAVVREIPIHGGVNNWYIDVNNPPKTYRVDLGYMTTRGRFYTLCRSNVITTPQPALSNQLDEHWNSVRAECDRIFSQSGGLQPGPQNQELRALFEERLRRPMSSGSLTEFGSGALGEGRREGFQFEIDAELIVFGRSDPGAKVCIQGEPIEIRPDGTFTLRYSLPDGRQILPAVAQSHDGIQERTIILAVERNTKVLEPMIHDGQE